MDGSFRRRFLAYLLATLLLAGAVWGIAVWSVITSEREQYEEAARRADRIAVFFERQTRSIFRYGDSYLKMIRREFAASDSLDAVRRLMEAVPLDTALVSHVTLIDAGGTPIFNSGYPLKVGVTTADRPYFVHQRDAAGDGLYVSLPHRGRNSGKLIVRLVRRMTAPDGSFAGVAFAALDAGSLVSFFETMNEGANSSATLVGKDKRIRARSTYGRLGPGQDISGSRIWRELAERAVGYYEQTSVVDGVTRHYAYRALSDLPLIVAVGVALDDLGRLTRERAFRTYLAATLATVLLTTLLLLFSREMLAAQRIGRSEQQVRAMRDWLETRVEERTAELKVAQDELLRKERLAVLGQLTGTVAHELRNPLATIVTSVAVIGRRLGATGGDLEKSLVRVRRNVERCNTIITELLDFTRARGIEREPVRLDTWLEGLVTELRPEARAPLVLQPGAGDTRVALDSDRARRAIINVVDNACDAVCDGRGDGQGEVRIMSRNVDDGVEIVVEDNGPGIDADHLEQIHEPLFSTKPFGVGLGLPTVARIMDEHEGRFSISSESGHGTRATLWFPVCP